MRTTERQEDEGVSLTIAADPATMGVDMDVPDVAYNWQLWLLVPSLPADKTCSGGEGG